MRWFFLVTAVMLLLLSSCVPVERNRCVGHTLGRFVPEGVSVDSAINGRPVSRP